MTLQAATAEVTGRGYTAFNRAFNSGEVRPDQVLDVIDDNVSLFFDVTEQGKLCFLYPMEEHPRDILKYKKWRALPRKKQPPL